MKRTFIYLLLILSSLLCADSIKLKSGEMIIGTILRIGKNNVEIETAMGKLTIDKDRIDSLDFSKKEAAPGKTVLVMPAVNRTKHKDRSLPQGTAAWICRELRTQGGFNCLKEELVFSNRTVTETSRKLLTKKTAALLLRDLEADIILQPVIEDYSITSAMIGLGRADMLKMGSLQAVTGILVRIYEKENPTVIREIKTEVKIKGSRREELRQDEVRELPFAHEDYLSTIKGRSLKSCTVKLAIRLREELN